MIFRSSKLPTLLEPFSDWQDRLILGKTLQYHLESNLNHFSDEYFCFKNTWLSLEAKIALKKGQAIVANDRIIAAKGDFLKKVNFDEFRCKKSFIVNYPWHILIMNEQIIEKNVVNTKIDGEFSPAANFDDVVHIGKGSRILPGVFIEGKVSIGKNCKIGPNCYLRGATDIGDNCHIGQSVEIKNSLIMNHTNIGHLSYIGDSVIGEKVNIGAGTVTANLRHNKDNHRVKLNQKIIETGCRKLGVMIGDGACTGINTSFYPACIMEKLTITNPAEIVVKGKFISKN